MIGEGDFLFKEIFGHFAGLVGDFLFQFLDRPFRLLLDGHGRHFFDARRDHLRLFHDLGLLQLAFGQVQFNDLFPLAGDLGQLGLRFRQSFSGGSLGALDTGPGLSSPLWVEDDTPIVDNGSKGSTTLYLPLIVK